MQDIPHVMKTCSSWSYATNDTAIDDCDTGRIVMELFDVRLFYGNQTSAMRSCLSFYGIAYTRTSPLKLQKTSERYAQARKAKLQPCLASSYTTKGYADAIVQSSFFIFLSLNGVLAAEHLPPRHQALHVSRW